MMFIPDINPNFTLYFVQTNNFEKNVFENCHVYIAAYGELNDSLANYTKSELRIG